MLETSSAGGKCPGRLVSYFNGALMSAAVDVHRCDASVFIEGVAVGDLQGLVAVDITALALRQVCGGCAQKADEAAVRVGNLRQAARRDDVDEVEVGVVDNVSVTDFSVHSAGNGGHVPVFPGKGVFVFVCPGNMRKMSFRVVFECGCGSFPFIGEHGCGSSVFNGEAVLEGIAFAAVLYIKSVVAPDKVDSTGTAVAGHVILHVDTGEGGIFIVYEFGGVGVRSYRSDYVFLMCGLGLCSVLFARDQSKSCCQECKNEDVCSFHGVKYLS